MVVHTKATLISPSVCWTTSAGTWKGPVIMCLRVAAVFFHKMISIHRKPTSRNPCCRLQTWRLFLITGQPCQLWMRCLLFLTSILFWQIDVSALRNVDMKTTSFAHISPHVLIILPHDTPSIIFYCFRQKKCILHAGQKKIDNNI
jgi:hypothetical protein